MSDVFFLLTEHDRLFFQPASYHLAASHQIFFVIFIFVSFSCDAEDHTLLLKISVFFLSLLGSFFNFSC